MLWLGKVKSIAAIIAAIKPLYVASYYSQEHPYVLLGDFHRSDPCMLSRMTIA